MNLCECGIDRAGSCRDQPWDRRPPRHVDADRLEQRLSGAGNALTALSMGALGNYVGASTIFFVAAALSVPALLALSAPRAMEPSRL
jgi:hypothetical protein